MDDEVFVVSDMTVEVHDFPTGKVIGFNGTTEWALDSLAQGDVVWLPREDQLRELLGTGSTGSRLFLVGSPLSRLIQRGRLAMWTSMPNAPTRGRCWRNLHGECVRDDRSRRDAQLHSGGLPERRRDGVRQHVALVQLQPRVAGEGHVDHTRGPLPVRA